MDSAQRMSQPRASLLMLWETVSFMRAKQSSFPGCLYMCSSSASADQQTAVHPSASIFSRTCGGTESSHQEMAGCSQYMRSIINMQPHGLSLQLGAVHFAVHTYRHGCIIQLGKVHSTSQRIKCSRLASVPFVNKSATSCPWQIYSTLKSFIFTCSIEKMQLQGDSNNQLKH